MGEKEKKKEKKLKKPGKKRIILVAVIVAVIAAAALFAATLFKGDKTVEFKILTENQITQDISSQVIPEYRNLERALA